MKFNIWTDFEKKPLTDILTFIVDNRGKTVPTTSAGHTLIATNCIKNERLYPVFEKVRFLSDETYKNWFRAHPEAGDIIFVNKGTPGRVCMVPDPVNFCIAQDMIAFRVNKRVVNNKYLLAILRSRNIQEQIRNYNVGDTIPHFKKGFLKEILVPIPPMPIQEYIGNLYTNISEKIELNNQINRNLEEQALALYHARFVQDQGKKRLTGRAGDFFEITIGKTPPRKEQHHFSKDSSDVIWVSISDMKDCGTFIGRSSEYLTSDAITQFNVKVVPKHTVLLSFKLTVGRVAITTCELATNEAIAHFLTQNKELTEYLYCYLRTFNYYSLGSTSSIATAVNSKIIRDMPFIMPAKDELRAFHEIASPLFAMIESNQRENESLVILRDNLLSKLMSGELDVSELDIQ